jgi:hypothetical protein
MSTQYLPAQSMLPSNPLISYGGSTEVPESDVCRLSYYLKCCVMGCGIAMDLPSNFFDYTNAHHLPQECKQMISNLAFQVFRLDHLLNRVIFIDDSNILLPRNASNIFFNVEAPADVLALARLASPASIPHSITGKLMICTSDWLKAYYVSPLTRHLTPGSLETSRTSGVRGNNDPAERIPRISDTNEDLKKRRLPCELQKEDDEQEYIPMAMAIPIDEPASQQGDLGVSLFAPGQFVKLCGLAKAAMNEQFAIVFQRAEGRILVRLPGDRRSYSVKPENLIIVEGSISAEALQQLQIRESRMN